MYDLHREILVASGVASAFSKNLSLMRTESKHLTYAAIAHKNQVNTISWDAKIEGMTNDQILAKDPNPGTGGVVKTLQVIQAKYCPVAGRNHPVLVVCTMSGAMIYEWNGSSLLHWIPTSKTDRENWSYTKGIACQGDTVFIGSYTGEVYCLTVKDVTVKEKQVLKEHSAMVVDLDADKDTLGSAGSDGTVVCWGNDLKSLCKTSTQHSFTCVAIYKSHIFCATVLGTIFSYNIKTGEVGLEISAHVRPINALDVAPEAGLILSGSEDSFVRIWKIIKGDPIEAECVYSKAVESVPIVGGTFLDSRGQVFALTGFDYPTIFYFTKTSKK